MKPGELRMFRNGRNPITKEINYILGLIVEIDPIFNICKVLLDSGNVKWLNPHGSRIITDSAPASSCGFTIHGLDHGNPILRCIYMMVRNTHQNGERSTSITTVPFSLTEEWFPSTPRISVPWRRMNENERWRPNHILVCR